MEVDDLELLELVNDYQRRSDEPTFNTLDDIPEALMIDALDEIADQLAYDNFQSYGCEADIAEEEGYDPDEMEDSDWDKLWETVDESQYYNFTIEEFEGDDEEWEGRK